MAHPKDPSRDSSIVFGPAQVVKETIESLAPDNTSILESRAGLVSTKVFRVFL